ncbi:hypothetical protein [Acinetobacter sp. ANC 3832]|uniref:hypothetical protein n=1 Tax=Acinetobacter sp. ANC 3832 TaxID=1977874 RepID=UPI000A338C75|nr:hypothetical protein [Acinetobacter sp. ANC 3832]OTG93886.1 hypothetical protein B9T35_09320 [Acinetobacter sp. ANC 3832]
MNFIKCPYCHSEHVTKLDIDTDSFKSFEKLFESISPSAMAALGIKLAKLFSIPSFVGGFVGVVVGGVLIIVSQHVLHKYYRSACHYCCHDCKRSFAFVN